MSQRGSFVTEYVYCNKCFEETKRILLSNEKYLSSIIIPSWEGNGKQLPIIAGKIGGLYNGEELHTFEFELIPLLEKKLCHSLRIAVLAEGIENSKIFNISPPEGKE